jgi:hypothetical protein
MPYLLFLPTLPPSAACAFRNAFQLKIYAHHYSKPKAHFIRGFRAHNSLFLLQHPIIEPLRFLCTIFHARSPVFARSLYAFHFL